MNIRRCQLNEDNVIYLSDYDNNGYLIDLKKSTIYSSNASYLKENLNRFNIIDVLSNVSYLDSEDYYYKIDSDIRHFIHFNSSYVPNSILKFEVKENEIKNTPFIIIETNPSNIDISNLDTTRLLILLLDGPHITSLIGMPKEVDYSIKISNTELTSIIGIPEEIDGDLELHNNHLLSSKDLLDEVHEATFVTGDITIS